MVWINLASEGDQIWSDAVFFFFSGVIFKLRFKGFSLFKRYLRAKYLVYKIPWAGKKQSRTK